jgi:hypothetical protein
MRLNSRSALVSIIVLTVIVAWFFVARAELTIAQQSAGQPAAQVASDDAAAADLFCAAHQGDGCWPQIETAKQRTARNER